MNECGLMVYLVYTDLYYTQFFRNTSVSIFKFVTECELIGELNRNYLNFYYFIYCICDVARIRVEVKF